ncbi:hypothetical protein WR164_10770 [Philodulcilactobacillus myokoensis]|uniref:HTH tetR-type domain-containing protein n=1 Tax=Philodulcilactobacillus myokoensis TaxID=2929573 RepID=A0A9W6B296_9LACO|nr:TetR/AcrR family transcriptional regulator [Philodulcilactobacillus myokoensis]GLB47098.1 hypothetical protein WR164_10770 [Philodulcilactobacillus myokoensis]
MRKTNLNKLNAIKKSVIDSCENYGIFNMTTAKIAKNAGVSPATIYLHYHDKKDLLSRLYEEVKSKLQRGVDKVINDNDSIDLQMKKVINFSINQYQKYPKEFNFVQVLWNNKKLLDQKAINFDQQLNPTLIHLFQKIHDSNEYVDAPQEILDVFFSIPLLIVERNHKLGNDRINQVSTMVINAIKK